MNASQATPHSLKSHVAHCQHFSFLHTAIDAAPADVTDVVFLGKQTVNINEVILLHRSQKGAMHMYCEERWGKAGTVAALFHIITNEYFKEGLESERRHKYDRVFL